ncbi:MAG: RNA polymerase sigma factor [Candidatus Ancillula trichonymphae]|nr:RNA polymerase sigma factor [Candidatus Ancillula trichonymphae]
MNNSKTNTKQKGAPETTGKTARKVAPESEIPAKTSVVVTAAPAKKFGSTPKKASKSTTPAKAVQVKSAPVVKPEETADAAPAKTAAADLSDMKKILGFEDLDEGGARPTYDDDFSDSFMTSDPIRDYLRQIGQIALLTHEQEKDIAKRIEVGLYAEHKLKAARDEYDSVDIRNLRRLVEEGNRAKEHLVEANLRLVVSLAKRFSGRGMRFQDLIQEGNIGLTRAVEKYDYSKSFRFSTYATWWIRQSITRAIADQGRTIRIPVHMIEIINRLAKVQKRLTVELGRSPSNAELAEQLDVSEQRISEIQKYSREPASIYATIGEDGDTEYGDLIEDTNVPDQIDVVSERFMREQLHKIIDTLSEKERAVITMRYGLEDQIVHTLDEIGRKLDVTRERIRQIEAKTMSKLQHPARSQLLKDYYER